MIFFIQIFLCEFSQISKRNPDRFLKDSVKVCSTGISDFLCDFSSGQAGFPKQADSLTDTDIRQNLYECRVQFLFKQSAQIISIRKKTCTSGRHVLDGSGSQWNIKYTAKNFMSTVYADSTNGIKCYNKSL